MSTWLDSILVLTIANNLRIYFGVEPRTVVSEVEILAASIEHMATLMRPIDESSKMHKQSSTNRAQRNRSKVTSWSIRSLHSVSKVFFCNCNHFPTNYITAAVKVNIMFTCKWLGKFSIAAKVQCTTSLRTWGWIFWPMSPLVKLYTQAVAAIWMWNSSGCKRIARNTNWIQQFLLAISLENISVKLFRLPESHQLLVRRIAVSARKAHTMTFGCIWCALDNE